MIHILHIKEFTFLFHNYFNKFKFAESLTKCMDINVLNKNIGNNHFYLFYNMFISH